MAKNIIIAAMLLCVVALAAAVIRLENYHYGSLVGMCGDFRGDNPLHAGKRHDCLHKTETRTNPLWHLFYGLRGE
jgi:hypothetical protein